MAPSRPSTPARGSDRSPPLSFSGAPEGTRALALILEDPDAPHGTFTHWTLFNLPQTAHAVAEDRPRIPHLPDGSKQGRNDFGHVGYGGPCPPHGQTHRYYFRLFALDAPLSLSPGAGPADVRRAMEEHVLARGELMARFGRE